MHRFCTGAVVLLAATLTFALRSPVRAADSPPRPLCRIAVVRDGPSDYFDTLARLVSQELEILAGDEYRFEFRAGPEFNAGWNAQNAPAMLDRALADPEVDLVLAAGILAAQAAARPERALPKPVISGFVQDPDAAGLPYSTNGYSTKTNFNFVVVPLRSLRDLEVFRRLTPFTNLAVIADGIIAEHLDNIAGQIREAAEHFEAAIKLVPAGDNAAEVLERLDPGADAVYLTPALRMPREEWRALIAGLNRRKLPTFSLMGYADVEAGALAGLSPEGSERLARRIALNIQQVLEGVPPEQLPVAMPVEEKLVINEATAQAIGFSPSIAAMTRHDFIGRQQARGAPLNMPAVLALALANNVNLAIKQAELDGNRQERNQALSGLLPQAEGYGEYTRIDRDRAAGSMGMQARAETRAGIQFSQELYNDPLISQYRAARQSYAGMQAALEDTRLDVMAEAAESFLHYLQTEALLRIEDDNLQLTQSNLESAQARRQAGTAGPEEVFRWQAQAATQKARVIAASVDVDRARINLNQILGVDLTCQWQTDPIQPGAPGFFLLGGRLHDLLTDQDSLEDFEAFIVHYGRSHSPLLASLDRSIEAQRILAAQARRRFVLPDFSAGFNFGHVFDQDFEGETMPGASSTADDDEWTFQLQARLPLFESGRQVFTVKRAQAQLGQLRRTRQRADQLTERNIRGALYAIFGSYPNMQLQETAADYSRRNLDVIREKYSRGTVSILDLLDAQNQSFTASQNAALAVYGFLQDIYNLQRAISWFEFSRSQAEKEAWVGQFTAFRETASRAAGSRR